MGKENADRLCDILAARGELLRQLKGLRAETARNRPEPNEWSVAEILQHMADVDGMMLRRFRDVLSGKQELAVFNAADWEGARSVAEKEGLPGVLRRAYAARVELLQVVSDLTPTDMEKTGQHPVRGPIALRSVVEMISRHDLDHAQQIAKTRAVVEG